MTDAYQQYLADIGAILVKLLHGTAVLSRRDCFAAAAMQGYIHAYADREGPYLDRHDELNVALQSVVLADALIEALNK